MLRLAKYLDRDGIIKLFHAFIRSNFHYANIVQHFTSTVNAIKMEKLQRRALRIVLNDYISSYKTLLDKAHVSSLYLSRIKAIAIETFKCINKINPKFLHNLFSINNTGYELRDNQKIQPPKVDSTTYGLHSFRYEASKIWNTVPYDIKHTDKLSVFITGINKWAGPQCICGDYGLCKVNLM